MGATRRPLRRAAIQQRVAALTAASILACSLASGVRDHCETSADCNAGRVCSASETCEVPLAPGDGGLDASVVEAGIADTLGSAEPVEDGDAADGNAADALSCPTGVFSSLIHTPEGSQSSAITWSGAGYTAVLSQYVPVDPNVPELSLTQTDGTGVETTPPTWITQDDGAQRLFPRVSFSGTQFGISYVQYDPGASTAAWTARFMRVEANLSPVLGSSVVLGDLGGFVSGTFGTVAIAWSQTMWGVAWSTWTPNRDGGIGTQTLWFQRFDAGGTAVAPAQSLGAYGLAGNGTPLLATATGWALVGSGSPGMLFEIPAGGGSRSVALPFDVYQGSIASSGAQYGIVADRLAPVEGSATFARVHVGGAVIAQSSLALGSSTASLPSVVWVDAAFVAVWIDGQTLFQTTAWPPASTGPIMLTGSAIQSGATALVAGTCGWAIDSQEGRGTFLQVQP